MRLYFACFILPCVGDVFMVIGCKVSICVCVCLMLLINGNVNIVLVFVNEVLRHGLRLFGMYDSHGCVW